MIALITVQELRYRLSATDIGFRQVMGNAISTVETYHQRVQDGVRIMRNWVLAATGMGSGVMFAMKRIVDSTGQAASSVRDVSRQIGVTAESLQRLRFAAQENGLAMQQFDAAMRAFVRRSAEAAQGNRAFLASFERIGISQEEVQAGLADTEELFLRVADGIAQLPTAAEQSAVAMALLGDVGRQMVPMLAGGRQEIERLMRQAEELGIVLDERNVELFAEYDATVQRFRQGLSGLRMQVATAILPIFDRLARSAESNVKQAVSWVRENKDLIAQGVILASTFTALASGLGAVALGATLGVRALGLVTTAISFLMSPLGMLITLVGLLVVAWNEDWGSIRTTTQSAVNFIREQWDRMKKWWEEADLAGTVREAWNEAAEVWSDPELPLTEKLERTITIVAKALVELAGVEWDPEDPLGSIEQAWRSDVGTMIRLVIAALITVSWLIGTIPSLTAALRARLIAMGGITALVGRSLTGAAGSVIPAVRIALTLIFFLDLLWQLLPESEFKTRTEQFFSDLFEATLPNIVRGALSAIGAVTLGAVVGASAWPIAIAAILSFAVNLIDWSFVGAQIVSLWEKLVAWYRGKETEFGWEPGEHGIILFSVRLLFDVLGIDWKFSSETERMMETGIGRLLRLNPITGTIIRGVEAAESLDYQTFTPRPQGLNAPLPASPARPNPVEIIHDSLQRLQSKQEDLIALATGSAGPSYPSSVSAEDIELMAKLVQAEASVEDFQGKVAVAAVVLNRVLSEEFPNSIREVIYQTNAFESVLNGAIDRVEATAEAFAAVNEALRGMDPTGGATFFWNPRTARDESGWFRRAIATGELRFLTSIGRHDFYRGARETGLSWAEGLRSTRGDAEQAAETVAQAVADYLIGQSPPPKGPLSEIDEGGARTIDAWFDGVNREIDERGGDLTATLRALVERMFDALVGVLESRFPEAAAFLRRMREEMVSTLDEVEQRLGGGGEIAQGVQQIRQETILWTDSLVRGLSDAIAYGRSVTDVLDNFLRMLASQFLQARVFGPLLGGFLPGVLSGLPVFHSGGLVLGGAGALVMHNGGVVPGLRSDERLIIAQTGERVLSRAQNAALEELLERAGEPQEVHHHHYYDIKAVDAKSFADLVARNPEAIQLVTLQDIANNGPIRKAIIAASRSG